jgi:hypothetical protein
LRPVVFGILPFAVFLVGLVFSTLRFRAQDPLGGLLYGEAGFLAMLALAILLPGEPRRSEG